MDNRLSLLIKNKGVTAREISGEQGKWPYFIDTNSVL